jgi:hypothetical protein
MSQNLFPNDGPGTHFGLWTAVATGSATSPTATYSASGGADSMQDVSLAASGTSGGVALQATAHVEGENVLALGFVAVASSTSANIVPFSIAYKDVNGNTIVTHVPIASAAAVASATQYSAISTVPDGAVQAVVTLCNLTWSATGGYTVTCQSPEVAAL